MRRWRSSTNYLVAVCSIRGGRSGRSAGSSVPDTTRSPDIATRSDAPSDSRVRPATSRPSRTRSLDGEPVGHGRLHRAFRRGDRARRAARADRPSDAGADRTAPARRPRPGARAPGRDRRSSSCPTCTGITSTFRRCVISAAMSRSSRPTGSGGWLRAAGFDDVREMRSGEAAEVGGVRIEGGPRTPLRVPAAARTDRRNARLRASRQSVGLLRGRHRPVPGDGRPAPDTVDLALIPVWGWGPTLGRGRTSIRRAAAEAVAHHPAAGRRADPLGHVLAARDRAGLPEAAHRAAAPLHDVDDRAIARGPSRCRPRSATGSSSTDDGDPPSARSGWVPGCAGSVAWVARLWRRSA